MLSLQKADVEFYLRYPRPITPYLEIAKYQSKFVLQLSTIPQSCQLTQCIRQWNDLATLLCSLVISVPDIHRLTVPLFGADNKNEIVKLQLTRTNLLLHSVAADVNVGVKTLGTELGLDFFNIIIYCRHNRNNEDLAWREPEWPSTSEVFCENATIG